MLQIATEIILGALNRCLLSKLEAILLAGVNIDVLNRTLQLHNKDVVCTLK